jgi:hypothetical protein
MGKDNVLIGQLHSEHCSGEHGHNLSFYFDCFSWVDGHWILETGKADAQKWAPACGIKDGRLTTVAGELTGALFPRARFVHGERPTGDFLAVECFDRSVAAGRIGESDETEATGAAGFAIVQDCDISDGAVLREELAEIVFSGLKREISYV